MCSRMETLGDLVDRLINERGETLTAFSERLGTNRQTVRGWRTSLPAPATLRRIADALEVPYSTVLTAALCSADYMKSLEDVLAHQTVHVVVRNDESSYGEGDVAPVAVFTNPDRATEFAEISGAVVPEADFDDVTIVVDAAVPPPAVLVYTLTWSHKADKITESSKLFGSVPTRIGSDGVSDVEGLELSDTGEMYQLRVDSLHSDAGREVLQTAIRKLRSEGRLLPPDVDVTGGRSGLMQWVYEQSLLSPFDMSPLQRMSSPPQRNNASPMQRMPMSLARSPVSSFAGLAPVEVDDLKAGDIGFIDDHAVLVIEPGNVIDARGQGVPLNEVMKSPGFKGFFRRAGAAETASTRTDGDGRGHSESYPAARALEIPYVWGDSSAELPRASGLRPLRRVIVNMAETDEREGRTE